MFKLCSYFDKLSSLIHYWIYCPLKHMRSVPFMVCTLQNSEKQYISCVHFLFVYQWLPSTPKIIAKGANVRRSHWPGNWTTPTNLTIRICIIQRVYHLSTEMRSTVVLQAHTSLFSEQISSTSTGSSFCKGLKYRP